MAWKDWWRSKPAVQPPAPEPEAKVQAEQEIGLGNAAEDRGELALAREHYEAALRLAPSMARVHLNLGNLCLLEGQPAAAIDAYQRALDLQPEHAGAWFNLGNVHLRQRQPGEAGKAYRRCLSLAPAHDEAELGLALALAETGDREEAASAYRRLLARRPGHAGGRANYAQFLTADKQYTAAAGQWREVLVHAPGHPYARGHACAARAYACDWEGLEAEVAGLERDALAGHPVALPFHLAILGHSASAQLQAARTWAADKCPAQPPLPARAAASGRIRLAYVSADFHRHATAALTARLFEQHDRTRFEVSAWSFGRDDGSAMRERLERAFDHFHDVRGWSDEAIARAIHASGCDIAIDLKGSTADARPAIFSARPAPIQVSWLGFPGTSGREVIDYLIADASLIGAGDLRDYSERVVWLPDSYQANDDTRPIAADAPTRAELGLPEQGFVFCCFNNNFKITPRVFHLWMRLLRAVPGSVLWLLADNREAQANLGRAAVAAGVAPERLVYAPRADLALHLARHCRADLFLDTLPCNAHTTASDALWAGLPVLTCRGDTFAGRVAASLLLAAGLPELVTGTLAEYEERALELATRPTALERLRERLGHANRRLPLFDSARFCARLESAYAEMQRRRQAGSAPAHFAVLADGSISELC